MLGRAAASLVRLYQRTLGRLLAPRCRYYPSCSEFAVRALRMNGLLVGGAQAAWRLVRCAPWGAGGVDHPAPRTARARAAASRAETDLSTDQHHPMEAAHG